jgi:hypothetical protein
MTPDQLRAHIASMHAGRTAHTAPVLDPVIRVLRAELARQTAAAATPTTQGA